MIYTGLNRTGEIEAIKAHGGGDVAEVYGGIGELDPIFYKGRTITGTPPLSFKALGKPLSDYLISGNTVQNGTPTPSDPVDVVGCGERTGNLFDITAFVQGIIPKRCTTSYDGTTNTLTINTTGADAHTGNENSYHVPVIGGETYTLSWDTSGVIGRVYIFENGLTDSSHSHDRNSAFRDMNVTMRSDTTFIIVRVGCDRENVVKTYSNIMLNLSSAVLPYEPYGYKINLTANSTEYPIYLGQVETTRKIKKLVLTGDETIGRESAYARFSFYILDMRGAGVRLTRLYCTHYQNISDGRPASNIPNNSIYTGGGSDAQKIFIKTTDYTTVEDFKSYLAAQYAAGTPITIWYVLAEPETGIVNEPLHKIGNYADTITMAQAGVTIPTSDGDNITSFGTTVKPSEVSITGNIKEVLV